MRLMPRVGSETAAKVGGLIALLAVELVVFTVLSPDFLTSSNLFNVMALDTENGIIALGMAVVIASGGIDLSVGSILALSSVTMGYAVQHGQPLAVAAVVCLVTGLVCGLINGVLVVVLRLHPLLVTLGTLALYRGLALGISNGNGFSGFPTSFEYFGQTYIGPVPAQVVVWLVLALAVYGVVNATPAGRRLLAVGINELAASFAGIRVGAVRLAVYGSSGLLTGVASLIYSSRVFSDRGDSGTGLELLAIAAVVVGGASIRGGEIFRGQDHARRHRHRGHPGRPPAGRHRYQLAVRDHRRRHGRRDRHQRVVRPPRLSPVGPGAVAENRKGGRMERPSRSGVTWRAAAAGIALLLPVSLAACSTGTGGSSASAASKKSNVIVLIPKQTSDPFFTNAEQGAKQAAAQLGYKIDYVGPTTADAAGQVTTIENAIRQHPAGITISGDDPNAVAPALKQAMKAGIVVSSYNADVAPTARQFFISQASNTAIAKAIVDTMAAQTGGKGNFLLVSSTSTAANQNTWIAYMRKYIPTKYPHMHIAEVIPGNDDPATVLSVTSSYLSAHKSTTTGVWVIGGGMSGAIKAEQQQGINPHSIPVAGCAFPVT